MEQALKHNNRMDAKSGDIRIFISAFISLFCAINKRRFFVRSTGA